MLIRNRLISISLSLAALSMLLGTSRSPHAARALKETPMPLPDDVVKAWKKAGAVVGWMGHRWNGDLEFSAVDPKPNHPIPAFNFNAWKNDIVAKLPPPAAPFGITPIGEDV